MFIFPVAVSKHYGTCGAVRFVICIWDAMLDFIPTVQYSCQHLIRVEVIFHAYSQRKIRKGSLL